MGMTNIREIWVSHASQAGNGVVKQKVEEVSQFNCFIGTILISKAKLFSLELDSDIDVSQNYLKRFTGVEIQVLPSAGNKKELIIILLENDLSDIFIMFIEDVIKSIASAENSENALFLISRRVTYWKRLFGKFSGGLLTPQQQRGLYGELYLLKLVLLKDKNYEKVIEAWQAPSGSNQDFYFGTTAVEVKTSKSNNPSIKISNEFQLDTTGFNNLFLAFFRLSELPRGEETLLKIISEIRDLLNSNADLENEFNLKLIHLGISQDLENEYNKTAYTIRNIQYYQIREGFPRIISSVVDNAISHISYEISPNECREFEIPFDIVIKEILHAK